MGEGKPTGMLYPVRMILHPLPHQSATDLLWRLHGQVSAGSSTLTSRQHPLDDSKGAPSARLCPTGTLSGTSDHRINRSSKSHQERHPSCPVLRPAPNRARRLLPQTRRNRINRLRRPPQEHPPCRPTLRPAPSLARRLLQHTRRNRMNRSRRLPQEHYPCRPAFCLDLNLRRLLPQTKLNRINRSSRPRQEHPPWRPVLHPLRNLAPGN